MTLPHEHPTRAYEILKGIFSLPASFRFLKPLDFAIPIATKTAAYTLTRGDAMILADCTSAAFTVTLPPAVDLKGRVYHIKKIDSSGNAVTLDGDGAETIDGSTTKVNYVRYATISVISDGSNWHIQ